STLTMDVYRENTFAFHGRGRQKACHERLHGGLLDQWESFMPQNKNSMNYVENNSGFKGEILRPLSAKILPKTIMEKNAVVDRTQLYAISGRSRKIQIQMAKEFGVVDYPAPAGGCLLTDKNFSRRLKDLMLVQKEYSKRDLYLLKHGRHIRLDEHIKIVVGKSEDDNNNIEKMYDPHRDIMLRHACLAGPIVLIPNGLMLISDEAMLIPDGAMLSSEGTMLSSDGAMLSSEGTMLSSNFKQAGENIDDIIKKAGTICAGYTKTKHGEQAQILVISGNYEITVNALAPDTFQSLMI
ncbi:MAG: hypothetical protein HQK67_11235, partial [Desulfamplus sp.]|nr:hypothetical protein [Desulfamplus sp.]